MYSYPECRCMATEIVSEDWTVRKVAEAHGISKSTAHKWLTTRLLKEDKELAKRVREVFVRHLEERASRGGTASAKRRA